MTRAGFPSRPFTAISAAIALFAACGGGSGTSFATTVDRSDDADAATLAQVAQLVASVDASARALGFDPAKRASAKARRHSDGASASYGLFPGLVQTNLVANKPEYGAQILEPELQNAWGIAIRPAGAGGHFWVGANRTAKSIQYIGDVGGTPLFQDDLKIVGTGGPVTGVAFNPGSEFVITQAHETGPITNASKFFFANISGTISAWTERARADGGFDRPTDSLVVVDGSARHSAFFGVAVTPDAERLLAADFGAEPAVRVYDGAFNEQAPLANPFNGGPHPDPIGFEAFNVQTLDSSVFAMYGRHVVPDPAVPLPTDGRLAEFDAYGQLIAKWRGRGYLNYPWGAAIAPLGSGIYSGCLLVGNFGDGTIVAFHPLLKVAIDYVRDDRGQPIVIDGLWGLQFGNGASLGEANHMYFAAGPNKEADGLFGKLQANPRTAAHTQGVSLCAPLRSAPAPDPAHAT
jgi:uncharacterized protein (TIGR03118 family)